MTNPAVLAAFLAALFVPSAENPQERAAPAPAVVQHHDDGQAFAAAFLRRRSELPVVNVATFAGGVLAVHVDSSGTFVRVHDGGLVNVAGVDEPEKGKAQGITDGPVPVLTTKWTDKKGMDHTVSTPVAGTGSSAMSRAIETHKSLVAALQELYPPKGP